MNSKFSLTRYGHHDRCSASVQCARSTFCAIKCTRSLSCTSISFPLPPHTDSTHTDISQGTNSELAGKSDACAGCANQEICASGVTKGPDPALPLVKERMKDVKRKILVLSGKGGVGKSTFTAQLGFAFAAEEGVQVRIIDSA